MYYMNMKETNLQKTKKEVCRIVKMCIDGHLAEIPAKQRKNIIFCWELIEELYETISMMYNVCAVKRTRELDTLVRNYFGEDTAKDLLNVINSYDDE